MKIIAEHLIYYLIHLFTTVRTQSGKLRLLVNKCIIIHTLQQITNDPLLI